MKKVTIFIRIIGSIDSRKLYDEIKGFGMNVTDCIAYTMIYGACTIEESARIMTICALYGDNMMLELTKNG